MSNNIYINVAVPVPMRQLFTYTISKELDFQLGCRVLIPFGSRKLVGVIIERCDAPSDKKTTIKPIEELISHIPALNSAELNFLSQCANYYHHPIGDVIQNALPVALRKSEEQLTKSPTYWFAHKGMEAQISKSAKKQLALYQLLSHKSLTWSEIRTSGYSKAQLNALEEKDLVSQKSVEPERFAWQDQMLNEENKLTLTEGQALCLAVAASQLNQFSCHLLFGITGSGKTEVYLQLIEKVIRQGKQVLVLVPEIGLTPQTLARFENRFNVPIYLHHSGLNDTERLETWQMAKCGQAAIIIGTRSSVFSPLSNPGLIIVDEEHDASYKQQDGYRYQGRDLAILRAKQWKVPIMLGSATPSFESLHNAATGKYQLHQLMSRPGEAKSAPIHIVDMNTQVSAYGLSQFCQQAIRKRLESDEQVLLFLNRRGYAPAISCKECHWVAECQRCNTGYTYHKGQNLLVCHHCNSQKRIPKQCPECGSVRINPIGQGTEQLEEKLSGLFPGYSTVRIDRDSTRRKNELAEKLQQINDQKHQILIGTQMLAKGHHFPNVTLVVILNMDSALYSYDYRATELMAQLLIQVSGRAGREEKSGSVLVQSEFASHPMLQLISQQGYAQFSKELLAEREMAQLPPYTYMALIRAEANFPNLPESFLRQISQTELENCLLAGPMPAPIEKRAGKFRYHLTLCSKSRRDLHLSCAKLIQIMALSPLANKVRYSIDIDPVDLTW